MAKEKKKFIEGAQKKGYSEETAQTVWRLIERFAGYGFNKAHSASYAMIAYQTAYMKANYPVEFMAALLTTEAENKDKVALAVEECRRMGITICPADINKSYSSFTIEEKPGLKDKKTIRFGLSAIKNVGKAAIEEILKAREVGGELRSLSDFCLRCDPQKVNKKVLESLIKVGAMDKFGKRAAMLIALDEIRRRTTMEQQRKASGQTSLFESLQEGNPTGQRHDKLPDVEELTKNQLLSLEKKLLGFYLTEHPLTSVFSKIEQSISHRIYEIVSSGEYLHRRVKIGGIVTSVRRVFTRRGNNEMAFVTIEDETSKVDVVVFPKIYEQTRDFWRADQIVIITGRVDFREEKTSVIAEKASLVKIGS